MRAIRNISVIMLLVWGLSFSLPAYATAAEAESAGLKIQQAIEQASKNNPELRKAGLTVDQSKIQRDDLVEVVEYIPGRGLVSPEVQNVVNSYQIADIAWNTAIKAEEATKDSISMQVISAYTNALKSYNNMEIARINLLEAQDQMRIRSLAQAIGMMSNYDYDKAKTGNQQQQEQYKYLQSQYDSSIASLRSLLGENADWNPKLTSKAILSQYKRDDVSLELSRGLSNSTAVWNALAQLDMVKSSEAWIIQGTTSEQQAINSGLKEASYEQAKRDSSAQIQQLYYGIDSLEGQIAVAENASLSAQNDSEIAELKYDLGLISQSSMISGAESRSSISRSVETTRLSWENMQASLVQSKAQFAFLTGKTIYDAADWNNI